MIIIDYSAISIAGITADKGVQSGRVPVQVDLARHVILRQILKVRTRFKSTYGEVVVAFDGGRYWRKDIFPYYKARRQAIKDTSKVNWEDVFVAVNMIREEIKQHLPYKAIQIPHCEADDVIGTLTRNTTDPVLIVSGDKDFPQLQTRLGVAQYRPINDVMYGTNDAQNFLWEHILKGDSGDGIPNILSDDDVFVNDLKRQKPLRDSQIEAWRGLDPEQFTHKKVPNETLLRNWHRNKALVDLTQVPDYLQQQILDTYKDTVVPKRSGLLNYFMSKRLRDLTGCLGDF